MISVIIPTFNEEEHITETIQKIVLADKAKLIKEIIIADGGSTDRTVANATSAGATVVTGSKKGRAAQMNFGASLSTSGILYFLHADTSPPDNFTNDITDAIEQGYGAGCFMLSFDHAHWFLQANCWFTQFDVDAIRFGDQSLFVTRNMFIKAGGFSEKLQVMEDQELISRLKKNTAFAIIKKPVLTSARKYLENGIYRTQGIFFLIYLLYRLGYSQRRLVTIYRKLIRQDKL